MGMAAKNLIARLHLFKLELLMKVQRMLLMVHNFIRWVIRLQPILVVILSMRMVNGLLQHLN